MTAVELELEHAKTLARACGYAELVPGLAPALRALADGIEKAEDPTSILDSWRIGFERGRDRARPSLEWHRMRAGASRVAAKLADDDAAKWRADSTGAYCRDRLDAVGISVHDEESLYAVLMAGALLVELTENATRRGIAEPSTLVDVANIAQSFLAGLLDYLPPEAKS